jgi:hypothetical protein
VQGVASTEHAGVCVLTAGGELVVAVGLWVDNSLLLMHWPTSTQQQQQQQLSPGCVMQLQDEQARSVAVLPVGGADVLLVGTNSGSVLMWQVEQQQQQQAGGWQLLHGRVVRISSTSVSLLPMQLPAATDAADVPASSSGASSHSSTVSSIYAHAGAGAVIRPVPGLVATRQRQQQAHQGSSSSSSSTSTKALLPATDCLLISRVCGSEACLTAAPVASADMPPHSLAWVSPSSKLCFGELDAVHKLRWRARGLPGTPLAMALHKPTNTLVLIVQADAGSSSWAGMQWAGRQQQQQLVLLDARSLAVLLVLGLAEGHSYTCLAVLDLPCTSQQQQQQQQSGTSAAPSEAGSTGGHTAGASSSSRPGLRPFIVLGSCLNMALSQAGVNATAAAAQSSADAAAGPSSAHAAAAATVPEELQVGILSFFELQASMSAAGQAAAAGPRSSSQRQMRYDLLLHGMTPLPVTPACVCTVVPEVLNEQAGNNPATAAAIGKAGSSERSVAQQQATEGTAAASKAAAEVARQGPVCLAVGSEAGVSLLHVLIDDAGRQQQQMVRQQLAAAAEVSGGAE